MHENRLERSNIRTIAASIIGVVEGIRNYEPQSQSSKRCQGVLSLLSKSGGDQLLTDIVEVQIFLRVHLSKAPEINELLLIRLQRLLNDHGHGAIPLSTWVT
jgi:hypothetical protein